MSEMARLYPYVFERFYSEGQPIIQVNYDSDGMIGIIFVYNSLIDAMVLADLDAFQDRHPVAFHVLQLAIHSIITDQDFNDSRKFGT